MLAFIRRYAFMPIRRMPRQFADAKRSRTCRHGELRDIVHAGIKALFSAQSIDPVKSQNAEIAGQFFNILLTPCIEPSLVDCDHAGDGVFQQ